jgi:hypothetical protein
MATKGMSVPLRRISVQTKPGEVSMTRLVISMSWRQHDYCSIWDISIDDENVIKGTTVWHQPGIPEAVSGHGCLKTGLTLKRDIGAGLPPQTFVIAREDIVPIPDTPFYTFVVEGHDGYGEAWTTAVAEEIAIRRRGGARAPRPEKLPDAPAPASD